jgi:hypothetical protein
VAAARLLVKTSLAVEKPTSPVHLLAVGLPALSLLGNVRSNF